MLRGHREVEVINSSKGFTGNVLAQVAPMTHKTLRNFFIAESSGRYAVTGGAEKKLFAEEKKTLDPAKKHVVLVGGMTRMPKVVETVSWAAKNGDRSENGDYLYGKKRLREIDRRIRFLTKRLDIAEVADPALHHGNDQVFFGATVTYADEAGEAAVHRVDGDGAGNGKRERGHHHDERGGDGEIGGERERGIGLLDVGAALGEIGDDRGGRPA